MSLFRPGGANYIPVTNLDLAASWYIEKLGLRRVQVELDEPEGRIPLGFERDECALVLGPRDKSSGELSPILFTSKLRKAREFLLSRGVQAGEIQQDAQGTHYFEMTDTEGNTIEVSEEPQ